MLNIYVANFYDNFGFGLIFKGTNGMTSNGIEN